ncbi:MAG TPA: alpha/beta fold hydrolase [Actinophytocola sp.]|jgi:pimeloyl-ACP methyl ester carboxylesterase|nr:alpha/beta fold hydrolase [Actinophytocola sp.]
MHGERLNDGLSVVATGEGPPLVVLPGLGRGADLSERVPRMAAWSNAAVARGLRRTVHLVNRPLHPPPNMTVAQLAGWYATALRERFAEPVDVMGTSAGGVTAVQLALDHPGTVRRLVLCGAASRVGEEGIRDLTQVMELEQQGRSAARLGSGLVADGPARLLMMAGIALAPKQPPAPGEAALVAAVRTWDVTGRLGEVGMPVLIVGGARDRLVPPDLMRATAAGVRDGRLVLLPGRGHITASFDRRGTRAIKTFLAVG